jgi:hypothetical protein
VLVEAPRPRVLLLRTPLLLLRGLDHRLDDERRVLQRHRLVLRELDDGDLWVAFQASGLC